MQLNLALIQSTINDKLAIDLSEQTLEKLNKYYELLIKWNKIINLTRITESNEATVKHYIDSLLLLKYIDGISLKKGLTLLDVGSGAGFPGIPIKLCISQLRLYLLESSAKKCDFLSSVLEILGLKAEIINKRSEEYAKEARESFDYVTSRALAEPLVSLELCLPFLRIGGKYIQFAGPSAIHQVKKLESFSKEIGGKLISLDPVVLPLGYGKRLFIVYQKFEHTSLKYPRSPKKIRKILKI